MTRAWMILGYGVAVALVAGAASTGYTGDHGGPEGTKSVCQPVCEQKKVTTKTYSDKEVEFCQTPLGGLFGSGCGPVRTKRVLVLHTHTKEVTVTKYVPVTECAQQACPTAVPVQAVPLLTTPSAGPVPGAMPHGQMPR